jgi:acylphosphatase
MTLYEEIYFEITINGTKSEIKKFSSFLKSGELDDFFEVSKDYINLDDNYNIISDTDKTELVFSNDEIGIEADEFDTDDFLELFCKAAKQLEVSGTIYDIEDNEFSFVSPAGDSYYYNSRTNRFNDELDDVANDEEVEDEED